MEADLPCRVSLTPFTPTSSRRLATHFTNPTRPIKQLDWAFQFVWAEEATSAWAIGGGLGPNEAIAWDLFSPMERVLVVAVIGVASAGFKRSREVDKLNKSVELRDQVLLSMQQKLDSLCEQLNSIKDPPETWADMTIDKNVDLVFEEPMLLPTPCFGCGCQLRDHHKLRRNSSLDNSLVKGQSGDQTSKYRYSFSNAAEAEERRLSDMSDWNSSVISSVDVQMNSIAIEQDVDNLKKESEEKDATIKELSRILHFSESFGSKRIAELEDIIRTKNMRITRLKKDMLVLEQKVMQLTRQKRPSNSNMRQIPAMAENVLFDMESSTSPSSSDSDCSSKSHAQNSGEKVQIFSTSVNSSLKSGEEEKGLNSLTKPKEKKQQTERPVAPLKEKSLNQKTGLVSSSSKRRDHGGMKLVASGKRWV